MGSEKQNYFIIHNLPIIKLLQILLIRIPQMKKSTYVVDFFIALGNSKPGSVSR